MLGAQVGFVSSFLVKFGLLSLSAENMLLYKLFIWITKVFYSYLKRVDRRRTRRRTVAVSDPQSVNANATPIALSHLAIFLF